jgi:acyl-CoA-dependent ceramide synthase
MLLTAGWNLLIAFAADTIQYICFNSSFFLNLSELWTDWPQREIAGLVKGYVLGQWAFWVQQVLIINIEDRRKDHWQMLSHHFVTIILIAASYAYHQVRVACLIMVLMDVIDLFLPVSHTLIFLLKYFAEHSSSLLSARSISDLPPHAT